MQVIPIQEGLYLIDTASDVQIQQNRPMSADVTGVFITIGHNCLRVARPRWHVE